MKNKVDPIFLKLSPQAENVFCYFLGKCDGFNNGELSAPQGIELAFLYISKQELEKALQELINADLLEITHYSNNTPNLYGLTCLPMFDEENPSDNWKKNKGDESD